MTSHFSVLLGFLAKLGYSSCLILFDPPDLCRAAFSLPKRTPLQTFRSAAEVPIFLGLVLFVSEG